MIKTFIVARLGFFVRGGTGVYVLVGRQVRVVRHTHVAFFFILFFYIFFYFFRTHI